MRNFGVISARMTAHLKSSVSGLILGAALALSSFQPASAQTEPGPTVLLADTVQFDGKFLIAVGSVEVFQDGTQLTASKIIFDNQTGALSIDGPIKLTDPTGDSVILASAAELDQDMTNGILRSARIVVANQLEASAAEIALEDGRYLKMRQAAASNCKICDEGGDPLWEFRAQEITHDREERQLYLTNAQFRVAGQTVLWLPRWRLPDPSLKRASGFLLARPYFDTLLGTGVEIPYFIALGDHKDLTISPLIATKASRLGLRYRQAFANGEIEVNGSLSSDRTRGKLRAHAFAEGSWTVWNGSRVSMDLKAVSDVAYLSDYEIFGGDRLRSNISLSNYVSDHAFEANIYHLRSLREAEIKIEDELPFLLGDFFYETPIETGGRGILRAGVSGLGAYRASNADQKGYDYLRLSGFSEWRDTMFLTNGMRFDAGARIELDHYLTRQDASVASNVTRVTPAASAKLSWPLERVTSAGAVQQIVPFAQLGWASIYGGDIPNNDSTRVELDEGNIFALSRFPGADLEATSTSFVAGAQFTHLGENLTASATVAQILFSNPQNQAGIVSDFNGARSDLLIGLDLDWQSGAHLSTRALFDESFIASKFETRLGVSRDNYSMDAVYSYVVEETSGANIRTLNEFEFGGEVKIADNLRATSDVRYNFDDNAATQTDLGLIYATECAEISMGLSRRFADTAALDPATRISIGIRLGAFDTGEKSTPRCGL